MLLLKGKSTFKFSFFFFVPFVSLFFSSAFACLHSFPSFSSPLSFLCFLSPSLPFFCTYGR